MLWSVSFNLPGVCYAKKMVKLGLFSVHTMLCIITYHTSFDFGSDIRKLEKIHIP